MTDWYGGVEKLQLAGEGKPCALLPFRPSLFQRERHLNLNPRLRGDKRNRKLEKLYEGKLHNLYTSRIFAALDDDIRQNVMGEETYP
jgi:hypothetical protein